MSPELTLALMLVGGLGTFVASLWISMRDGHRPEQQLVVIALAGIFGVIIGMFALIILTARWVMPYLMS